jgi:Flp pilus assembly pilin Flp
LAAYPGSSASARAYHREQMNDIDTKNPYHHDQMNNTDNKNASPGEQRSTGNEAGQALAEYALILAFVSITAVGITPLGQWVASRLGDVASAV